MWHPYYSWTSGAGSTEVDATIAQLALDGLAATVTASSPATLAFFKHLNYGVPQPPVLDARGALTTPWLAWVGFTTDRINELIMGGSTAQRPTNVRAGFGPYWDVDLGLAVWYSGTGWVDALGNPR